MVHAKIYTRLYMYLYPAAFVGSFPSLLTVDIVTDVCQPV